MKEYRLKKFSIYIGSDIFGELLENLIEASYSQVIVLVDEKTEEYCLPMLRKYLLDFKVIRIRSGEQNKNLETAQLIWNELQRVNATRKAVLINLGGGVIGDMGGFCAATFKRGLDFINIPTTLLSMVDSAIGGKLGIDYNGVKNAIGLIRDPKAIYINPDFLATLPRGELINGYAELIKHALIADENLWKQLQQCDKGIPGVFQKLINDSVKIKLKVVTKDPFENSTRKVLNFGHTIGHAIEAWSLQHDKTPLKHGEAVAIGTVCESFLSREVADLSNKELKEISAFMLGVFPKYSLKSILSPDLIRLMKQDKKNENEEINFTLLKRIGKAKINYTCTEHQVARALNYYDSL